MIRFVDLRSSPGMTKKFAFWDTITDKFIDLNGDQAWEAASDFVESAKLDNMPETPEDRGTFMKRCLSLMPEWAFDESSIEDVS